MQLAKNLCYLENRCDARNKSEAAVFERIKLRYIKLRKCGELLYGRKLSLYIKERIYWNYVKSAKSYRNKT